MAETETVDVVVAPGWCEGCDEYHEEVMARPGSVLALGMGGEAALGSVVGVCPDCVASKVAGAIKQAIESLGLDDGEAA